MLAILVGRKKERVGRWICVKLPPSPHFDVNQICPFPFLARMSWSVSPPPPIFMGGRREWRWRRPKQGCQMAKIGRLSPWELNMPVFTYSTRSIEMLIFSSSISPKEMATLTTFFGGAVIVKMIWEPHDFFSRERISHFTRKGKEKRNKIWEAEKCKKKNTLSTLLYCKMAVLDTYYYSFVMKKHLLQSCLSDLFCS